MKTTMRTLLAALAALSTAACSASSSNGAGGDAGTGADADTTDAVAADAGAEGGGGSQCSAAIEQALHPVAKVATTPVSLVSESGGTRVVFVNATAGGSNAAASNPYVYLNLETGTQVAVSDVDARTSDGWDLALKRYVVFTNSGDAGLGKGGAKSSAKGFDVVAAADATGFATETFFDASCNVLTDPIGGLQTTFSAWYGYDQQTNALVPAPGSFIVRGGTGKLYKLAFVTYYGAPDGGTGTVGGEFVLKVAPL